MRGGLHRLRPDSECAERHGRELIGTAQCGQNLRAQHAPRQHAACRAPKTRSSRSAPHRTQPAAGERGARPQRWAVDVMCHTNAIACPVTGAATGPRRLSSRRRRPVGRAAVRRGTGRRTSGSNWLSGPHRSNLEQARHSNRGTSASSRLVATRSWPARSGQGEPRSYSRCTAVVPGIFTLEPTLHGMRAHHRFRALVGGMCEESGPRAQAVSPSRR